MQGRKITFGQAMRHLENSHVYTTVSVRIGDKCYSYQKRDNKLVYFNEKTMKREVSSLTINDALQGEWFIGGTD